MTNIFQCHLYLRGGELPSDVTPAAETLGDGPGVAREPAAQQKGEYQKEGLLQNNVG